MFIRKTVEPELTENLSFVPTGAAQHTQNYANLHVMLF